MLIFLLSQISITHGISQEIKRDNRISTIVEDEYNQYDEGAISKTDILKGLELLGVRVHKFDLPGSSAESTITLLAREFKNGKEVSIDTITNTSNGYYYWETGNSDPYIDYIKSLTIFSNTDDNKSELQIDLTSFMINHKLELEKTSEHQFYQWRKYQKTRLIQNKEIPLLIFASSWQRPHEDFQRFCGVVRLAEGDPDTQELLDESPHYVLISLLVE